MSHISRLPLSSAAAPWKLFVIHLQGGAGVDAGRHAARTCLVVKCHRQLNDALDAFIRREETLGRTDDAYSMILLDAALRFDDVTDDVDPAPVPVHNKFQSLQFLLFRCKVNYLVNFIMS